MVFRNDYGYHGGNRFDGTNLGFATSDDGIMLLDLQNPKKIVGMCKQPLIAPETPEETDGFRSDVIFPGGMILEPSGEVKIYYGASDTVENLATAHVDDLIKLCTEPRK